ncbi:glycosyltransferase family 4 protein [Gilvimarinus sp. F26214L]|uniref:glycosyltransferase family 4 protein n=1 Tax=Gilvimarinus sp. DZF01 TaxID=3461371 RepID=UPI0040452376
MNQVSHKGRILFISKRRDAASSRYRIFQYWDYLRAAGWELDYLPATRGRLQMLRECARADVVVIQRRLFDPLTLALMQRVNPRLVFDYDDAIFLRDDGGPSPRRMKRFLSTTGRARLCLAGNRYLADHSRCPRTVVFPTTVEMARYGDIKAGKPPALTLVWIGSRSTSRYLEHHRESLEALGQAFPELSLKVIGDFTIDFAPLKTYCIQWSEEAEVWELASAHIGIAPMTDDPWTRGKCALKVIQYMACGLPVISSNSGANAEIIQPGINGYLVTSTQEWIDAVRQLQDGELRQKMGTNALQRARDHYSAGALAKTMDELFTELLA